MNYAIFDIDDTLCSLEHRKDKAMESGKMNFKILFDSNLVKYDLPQDHVVELAQTLNMFNTKIIVMTARPYYMEEATKEWLKLNNIPFNKLITKEEWKKLYRPVLSILISCGILSST